MNPEVEDPFHQINSLPQLYFQQGLTSGRMDKQSQMKQKSFEEGLRIGKEIGWELGYYGAVIENIKSLNLITNVSELKKEKLEKLIFDLEANIVNFECGQPLPSIQTEMTKLRTKFKILLSICNIKFN